MLTLLAALFVLAPAAGAVTVRTFSTGITAGSQPTRIVAGRDGNLWFTERGTSRLGRITPSGVVSEFPTADASAGPFGIASSPSGSLIFTQRSLDNIGRLQLPATMPDSSIVSTGDEPEDITSGSDGRLWFVERGADRIGRVDGFLSFSPALSLAANSEPAGIVAGPDGNVWFTEFGANRVGKVDGTDVITEFTTGITPNSGPSGIAAGPDGNLWFTEKSSGKVARITPAGVVTEFPLPAGNGSEPESIVAGPDGAMWFTEGNAGRVGRIEVAPPNAITEFSVGAGPAGITVGPDADVWFTLSTGNRVGRVTTGSEQPSYTDGDPIVVPKSPEPDGPADRYPASIEASGHQGTVTDVDVRLNGLSHANASDVEALLVGPQGQKALVLADSSNSSRDVATGETITFDDDGRNSPANLVSGIFKPILGMESSVFEGPAPAGPYESSLQVFDGTDPNGVWRLFVRDDDTATGGGALVGGWSLDIETTGPDPVQVPGPTVEVPVAGPIVNVPGPTTTVIGPPVTVPDPLDTTRPALTVSGLAARMPQATFRKGAGVRVTASEAVTLDVELSTKPRRVTVAAVDSLVLFERTLTASGATTIAVKPSARRLGRPKKRFRALLRIVASDKAGNRTTVRRTITVVPDKRKRR